MALTTQQQINIGRICSVLASNELNQGKQRGGQLDEGLPLQLWAITEGLEMLYDLDQTNAWLIPIGNDLISKCRHQARASTIINTAGAPVTPSTLPVSQPAKYDFEVSASSFITTGETFKYFPSTWIGWDILFIRGSVPQSITVPDFGNYFLWDAATAKLTLLAVSGSDPSAMLDERFQIYPIGGSAAAPSGVGTAIVSPIKITGADFVNDTDWNGQNAGGVTVSSSYTLQVFYNTLSRYLTEGSEWNRTTSGFQIIINGTTITSFDATGANINDEFYISMSA